VIEVQSYVAVMALLVGVVNALGATAAQALAQAQDWRTRYRQVLDSNRTVVASFDARTGAAEWGEGASELLRTNAGALLTVQDFIAHADPQEQPALHADWRDLAQGQRDHMLWKNTLRWSVRLTQSINSWEQKWLSPRTVIVVFGHAARMVAMSHWSVSKTLAVLFLRPGFSNGSIRRPL
jgi:hypothetical protein